MFKLGSDRQIDMILICDSLSAFHSENLKLNKSDYSNKMGRKSVNQIIDWNNKSAGLLFNPFVKTELGELKYGIISTEKAREDLETWSHLYLAGRLHKPVKVRSFLGYKHWSTLVCWGR